MAVYFHGNFGLNRQRLAGLLTYALENPELKDKDLAQYFGYGAPYAQRYRQWLFRTGLSSLRLPLKLTPLGAVVYDNDPKLESLTTQWFMHWELVTDPERAEAWHFFWYDFLPKNECFTKDELQMALMQELSKHSEEHFGPESTMIPGITKVLLGCYNSKPSLGDIGIIIVDEQNFRKPTKFLLRGPWKSVTDLYQTYIET